MTKTKACIQVWLEDRPNWYKCIERDITDLRSIPGTIIGNPGDHVLMVGQIRYKRALHTVWQYEWKDKSTDDYCWSMEPVPSCFVPASAPDVAFLRARNERSVNVRGRT